MRRAVYPGSFNPPTIAHYDLSLAVCEQRNVDVVVWSLSVRTLGKDNDVRPTIGERHDLLQSLAADVAWLEVQTTESQLLSDIARGFDVVVMGADKWEQINEPQWYQSDDERTAALASLPELAVAPRSPHGAPAEHLIAFENMHRVSSTAARAGAHHLMHPAARASGLWD